MSPFHIVFPSTSKKNVHLSVYYSLEIFTRSDEARYQHAQPVYFPEELVDDWESFSRRGLYYCYNISLKGCLNTRAAPSDIILAVKCDMGPEFLRTSFTSGGVEVTVEYLDAMHLDQEQVKVEFMSSSFLNVCILFLVSSINASIFKFEVSCADSADDFFCCCAS
jgi:hypothetical protein